MRRRAVSTLVVGAAALAIAGCGGDDSSSNASKTTSGAGSGERLTLNVANASTDLSTLAMFVADARGLFEKQNLDVNFTAGTNTNRPALLASKKVDLIYDSNGVAIKLGQQGQDLQTVFGLNGYSANTELWSGKVKTLEEAQKLDKCRIGTTVQGGSTYGYAKYWKEKYGLKCDISIAQAYDILASGARSGNYDLVTIPLSTVSARPQGVNVLIKEAKTGDPSYPQLPGGNNAEIAGFLGIKGNLAGKREQVERFIRGLVEAQEVVDDSTIDELVKDVQKTEIFRAIPPDVLKKQIETARPNVWRDPASKKVGYIPAEVWKDSLESYGYWGMEGFEPSDPAFGYDRLVDMSYYDAATKAQAR